jgi:hypothetical protein
LGVARLGVDSFLPLSRIDGWESGDGAVWACWEELDDPRAGNVVLHDFRELLMIACCSKLFGGQSAVDVALFARAKAPFLPSFLKLENGPPGHETFSRLFRLLDT